MKAGKIIEVKNLSYRYPGHSENAVQDVSFSITRGEFVGIIGPNGSGKTTLIKNFLGILKHEEGHIFLFGKQISEFKEWSRIGYVPQKVSMFDPNFPATVFEVVRMGLAAKIGLFRMHTKDDARAVTEALKRVEMLDFAERRISQLSGGQQQRVLIARALVAKPDALILDEPTAEVDINAQRAFYALLKRLNKEMKLTIILIMHDIGLVTRLVDKVICLNRTLLCYGPPTKMAQSIERLFQEHHVVKHACDRHSGV
jgi:zinc transport system ATP-binding protein